jgi:release factor glutamine methyltransferase
VTAQPGTVAAAVAAAAESLAAAGFEEPRREARLLVALALGVEPAEVFGYPERPIDAEQAGRVARLAARRAAGEPVSRLRGSREFWSLEFLLSPETLDPRPDSETVVAGTLDQIRDRSAPLRLVDFGTGTGCLLLALLSELPNAFGVGVDRSEGAARTARLNAARLGFSARSAFVVGDWGRAVIDRRVDVIVANPPYIPSTDLAALPDEVRRFDPSFALDGGPDGLAAYRALADETARLLKPGGVASFEVGAGQAAEVVALMRAVGLEIRGTRPDLAGIARCVTTVVPAA